MKRFVTFALVIAALLAVVALSGCGSSQKPEIHVTDKGFEPAQLTIKTGDVVTWINDGKLTHAVSGDGFDLLAIYPKQSDTHLFKEAGTYQYYDRFFPDLKGTITVQ